MLKQIIKKSIALLLTTAISLCAVMPVSATNITETPPASSLFQTALIDVLRYVETQKAQFGLENVNFSTLSIGNPIHTYEYINNGLRPLQPIYPLRSGERIVAIAQSTADGNCQISTNFAHKLNDSAADSVAIIYDANGAYLFDGTLFTRLYENIEPIQSRETLSDLTSSNSAVPFSLNSEVSIFNSNPIVLADLEDASPLNYTPSISRSVIYSCDVDFVQQTQTLTCWAASIACICNYIRCTTYTSSYVVNKVYSTYSITLDDDETSINFRRELSDVATYMRGIFRLAKYAYCTDSFSTNYAISSLQNDHPLILNFYPVNDITATKHAVVVSAANVTSSYLTLMDPQYGFITASHNGSYFTYTSPTTSNTMRTGTFVYYDEDFAG